ncbi:unnamed protein product [Anisakis simplex]|uniref:Peroxisomal membrane protein PEX13 n=1 Tax=Anisakis simplex TaxID=6269 RepID=A0A0M3JUT2_ANISI|nr:unnamed protein product [Anisakis simplex]
MGKKQSPTSNNHLPPPVPPRPAIPGENIHYSTVLNGPVNNPYAMPSYGYAQLYPTVAPYPNNNMYGNYNYTVPTESAFARLADESSRGAFQNIDAIVTAVTSIANLLTSTQNAIHSSFKAVIGVVEQFSRLKSQFMSLLVTLSVFRWLKRIWRSILVILRLRPANFSTEQMVWHDINMSKPAVNDWFASYGIADNTFNWPALLFWLVAIGGPYLIYKCIFSLMNKFEETKQWAAGFSEHYNATGQPHTAAHSSELLRHLCHALYDFVGHSERELSFRTGQTLRIAPRHQQPPVRGWLLASSEGGEQIGLVPMNYIKITGRKLMSPTPETETSFEKIYEEAFRLHS